MKNVIIIHGCPSNVEKARDSTRRTYDKHWIPWIKRELIKRNISVETPLMPTPWEPKYSEWKDILDNLNVNEESVLIGHSCGGAFLVRWLGETKKRIEKLVLVSPGKSGRETRKALSNLYGNRVYRDIGRYVKEQIVIFTADDDMEYHIRNAYEYEKELPAKVIHFREGYGHFTLEDMGTEKFPELLKEVLRWKGKNTTLILVIASG